MPTIQELIESTLDELQREFTQETGEAAQRIVTYHILNARVNVMYRNYDAVNAARASGEQAWLQMHFAERIHSKYADVSVNSLTFDSYQNFQDMFGGNWLNAYK